MRYLTVLYMNGKPTNITHPFDRKIDAMTYANYLGDNYHVMSEDEYRKEYRNNGWYYTAHDLRGNR